MALEETLKNLGSKAKNTAKNYFTYSSTPQVNDNILAGPRDIIEYEANSLCSSGLYGKLAMFLLRNAGSYIINAYSLRNAMRGVYATSARSPIILIDRGTNGDIVGAAAVMFETNGTASGFMATGKEFCGQGIGRSLVRRSIEIAKKNGSAYIANVAKSNIPSQKIMESLGMHVTGTHSEGRHHILEYAL